MSVRRAQREVSPKEFRWWQAYYLVEPFGEQRADLRMARTCAAMSNAWKGKNQRPFTEDDFLFKFKAAPAQPQDWRVMKTKMKMFAEVHNAARRKGKR